MNDSKLAHTRAAASTQLLALTFFLGGMLPEASLDLILLMMSRSSSSE